MKHPRSAFGAPSYCQRLSLFEHVQACAGRLGAAALSPSRGRYQRPGKAGSAVAREQTRTPEILYV
jgi:hypothetical protein